MTEQPRPARDRGDEGFALVEVIVALGIFLVVMTALLPQLIVGIRAIGKADSSTAIKTVTQQEIDRLRGLPFRVSLGAAEEDVDLLDLYYPDTTASTMASSACTGTDGYALPATEDAWHGLVGAASAGRCDYEPAGDFYRTVTLASREPLGDYAVVRDVQFLSAGTAAAPQPAPVAPTSVARPVYDTGSASTNNPPTSQVGVTVTVLYSDLGTVKAHTAFTQIAKHQADAPLLRSGIDVEALQITSTVPSGAAMSLAAGVLNLDGTLGDASNATASIAAVVGRLATGDPASSQSAYGASATLAAPPPVDLPSDTRPARPTVDCAVLCWGPNRVGVAGTGTPVQQVGAENGLPHVGDSDAQATAAVTRVVGERTLKADNRGTAVPGLGLDGPPVFLADSPDPLASPGDTDCFGAPAAADRLAGTGYFRTSLHGDSEVVRDVQACAAAQTAGVGLMPTQWAPQGVIQVRLDRSVARCDVVGDVAQGDFGFAASVRVSDGAGGYGDWKPAETFVPSTEPIPGKDVFVDKFVPGWEPTPGSKSTDGGDVTVTVPGLTVRTVPTRMHAVTVANGDGTTTDITEQDVDSALSVTFGAVSCSSEGES